MQRTKKLYYDSSMLCQFSSEVLDCTPKGDHWLVVLAATAFYPEGGGQPADHGRLGNAQVLDVHEKEGVIFHTTNQPLSVGTTVEGEICWQRRLDLMQQHTGEHILSGLLHNMFGAENVGFHIGQEFVTMDMNIPLSEQQLLQAETAANQLIWKNIAVECSFPSAQELEQLDYRSKKEIQGQVRIVTIPQGDCCACCGTHLPYTGMVGQIKLLDWQNYKGGTRLTVACGGRALADYRIKRQQLAQMGAMFSLPANQAAQGAQKLQQQLEQTKAQLAALQNVWFDTVAEKICPDQSPIMFVEGLSGDGLRSLCLRLCERTPLPCGVFSPKEQGFGYAIGQKDGNITALTKAINQIFGGKGGGKPFLTMGSLQATQQKIEHFWNTYKEDTTP